jgi:hypothetical protein
MEDTIVMFLITSASALFGAILKTLYDSKCRKCKMCCIEIDRDIEAEVDLEEHKIHREPTEEKI